VKHRSSVGRCARRTLARSLSLRRTMNPVQFRNVRFVRSACRSEACKVAGQLTQDTPSAARWASAISASWSGFPNARRKSKCIELTTCDKPDVGESPNQIVSCVAVLDRRVFRAAKKLSGRIHHHANAGCQSGLSEGAIFRVRADDEGWTSTTPPIKHLCQPDPFYALR